mgnify:FL=1
MKIGFFTVYKGDPSHYVVADIMIRSCLAVMPDVPIVQMTDMTSPEIPNVTEVRRLPSERMAVLRMRHQAACEGEWLFLDTDCVVKKDVRDVFKSSFDIALADRNWPHIPMTPQLEEFNREMPFNIAIAFSRSPAFWQAAIEKMHQMPEDRQSWMGDQYAVCEVIREGRFTVKVLPGMIYHYPPGAFYDDGNHAAILHYKGHRKPWMIQRYLGVAE